MEKFEWDLGFLLKREKELEEKLKSTSNLTNKELKLYQEVLSTYKELISNYNNIIHYTRLTNCDDYDDYYYEDDETEDILSIEEFENEILSYANPNELNILLPSISVLSNYSNKINPVDLEPYYFGNQDLVDYTISLLEKIPNQYIVQKFKELSNPKNKLLHIKHEYKIPLKYYGLTFVDTEKHIPYGIISRKNTIQDIITSGHELFHMVLREKEKPFFVESGKTIYTETEGYFANMLFCELLKQEGFSSFGLDFLDSYDLFKNKYIIQDSFITISALSNFKKLESIDFDKLDNYLREYNINSPINEINFQGYLRTDFVVDLNYAFSYLVALDLFSLYKKDPEKAINNLLNIPTLLGENIEKELKSIDVTFHEDGYQNLNNQCQKLLTKTTSSK